VFFFALIWNSVQGNAQQIDPEVYNQLEYRHIGPKGNRTIAVAGVPGDPNIYYIGSASGGIFKSTDGGIHWDPVFDDQQVSSVSALAVALSDSNIIWAGTGETFIRGNISIGNGIYKSTDAGKTWKLMGLEKTGRIGRILIHPKNPDVVFAAALGHSYGSQPERGVFRTTDGGKTWERVLFVNEDTGCSDIAMDPNNPQNLIAGMWQLEIKTWEKGSGGPSSGLYLSRDGGTTWKHLEGHGLPDPPLGKIGVAIAPTNSNRVYALIETGDGVPYKEQETTPGELWGSNDGGENWELISYDRNLAGRFPYYTRCVVAPDDQDEVYFVAARLSVSIDGGKSTRRSGQGLHGDYHDMWIDPTNADRMIVSNDGGAGISVNRGQTWYQVNLPNAQMYHVAADNQIPYYAYGNLQDGPTCRGPSNSRLSSGQIPRGMWHSIGAGEAGWSVPDPVDNNIIWSGTYGGRFDRYDLRTGHARPVDIWPDSSWGSPPAGLKYRFHWTAPIVISPHDHNKVYIASQYVHQTTDGGQSWKVISPDLTTNNKEMQQSSGGLSRENAGIEYACTILALAESPLEEGLIWAGTKDGLLHVSRDGGANWVDITPNIPNLPPLGTVRNIEPSRYDAGTCYVTVDFHEVNNRDPYVYRTTDYGRTWKSISSDIPKSVLSFAHCVREDPVRKGMLYLGTENALYVSFNDGTNWIPLQNNLPHAPVTWIVIQEHFNDLVVGTYGRGFWIMDDITPIRELTPEVLDSDAHLFLPRPAYRFRYITSPMTHRGDPVTGQNPPYGADINYYLKSVPTGDVKITILDGMGETVRTLEGTKKPGINRIWWDLRYDLSRQAKLRTSPLYAPHVRVGPEGWRPAVAGRVSVLAAPGTYTVQLGVGEQEFTRELVVKKDPHSAGTEADIRAQVEMLLELRDNASSVADMVNQIEWIRKQIYDLMALLEGDSDASSVTDSAKELDKKYIDLEERLYQLKLTGRGQDSSRYPDKLLSRVPRLASHVGASDFSPTTQAIEVHAIYKEQIANYRTELGTLINKELFDFNSMLEEKNIPEIYVVKNP
jgi:photosystem II stability/assembly factor-like uncharacterized protein